MVSISNCAGTHQLAALLGPDTAAAGENPRCPDGVVVVISPHHGGVAAGGQRDGTALQGDPNCAGADQFAALLGPDTAAAGENPRCPGASVVGRPAHYGGVAVGRKCNGPALVAVSNPTGTHQLAALLGPDAVAARVDPCRPDERVVDRPAYNGGVAVGRKCD